MSMYNETGSYNSALYGQLSISQKPSGSYLTSYGHYSTFSKQSRKTSSLGSFDFCFRLWRVYV